MAFINVSYTPFFECADVNAQTVTFGLMGEIVDILSEDNGFYHVKNHHDGYMGYVQCGHITDDIYSATHSVSVRETLVFKEQNIKSPCPVHLPFGAKIHSDDIKNLDEKFIFILGYGYGIKEHFMPIHQKISSDLVKIAENYFISTPYLWGGRMTSGIDCSGLIQICAAAAGYELPRDAYQQEAFLTQDIQNVPRKRGDIVFWRGHVGIMKNDTNIIHANAHHMMCVSEPLSDVVKRANLPITSVKRLK